jgi:hypothetical protein
VICPGPVDRAVTAPALDIDILDEQAAQIVEATARLYLEDKGEILVRIGLPPKRAILLRTDKPFKKIVRKLYSTRRQGELVGGAFPAAP